MFLRFEFSNFGSFREKQELSWIAGQGAKDGVLRNPQLELSVLPTAAVYGANASGKTNVLKALQFMARAVADSHTGWKPDAPISRNPFVGAENEPSAFAVDFVLGSDRWRYGFAVDSERVLAEHLNFHPGGGRRQAWFERSGSAPMKFSSKMPGSDNRTIENLTRKNSLFLSAAAQLNHEALLPVYKWFSESLIFVISRRSNALPDSDMLQLCKEPSLRLHLAKLVAVADLGVTDIELQEEEFPDTI